MASPCFVLVSFLVQIWFHFRADFGTHKTTAGHQNLGRILGPTLVAFFGLKSCTGPTLSRFLTGGLRSPDLGSSFGPKNGSKSGPTPWAIVPQKSVQVLAIKLNNVHLAIDFVLCHGGCGRQLAVLQFPRSAESRKPPFLSVRVFHLV
jgi:hypothetical protein